MNTLKIFPQWKRITYTCTTVCNYSCSYCTEYHYNGKYRWQDNIVPLLNLTNEFRKESPLIFDIMGGEPTLWPKLQDFCKTIVNSSTLPTAVTFTTNGSRTINYWKKFDAPIDELGFSFHPESANEDHFINVFRELHSRYRIFCVLMMPVEHFEKIKMFYNRLLESGLEINVRIKLISDWHHGTGLLSTYTKEMLTFAKERFSRSKIKSIVSYDFFVDDKKTQLNEHLINTSNNYTGWKCYAGRDNLVIEPNGEIFGSHCKITKSFGNINSKYNIISDPVICNKPSCVCGTDVQIYKQNEIL